MDLMQLFRGGINAPAKPTTGAPAPAQQGTNPPAFEQRQDTTNTNANGGQPVKEPAQPPKSPLDDFAKIFENTPNDPNAPTKDPNAPYFQMDPKLLSEAVGRQNFTDGIEGFDEQISAAFTNQDPQALKGVLNSFAQNLYGQMAQFSANVANRTTREGWNRHSTELPGMFKDFMGKEALSSNPALSHSGVQPLVDQVREQIKKKFPNASSAEMSKMVGDYFKAVADTINNATNQPSQEQATKQKVESQKTDFSSFF